MKVKLTLSLIIALSILLSPASSESCIDKWSNFSVSAEKEALTLWIKNAAREILHKKKNPVYARLSFPAHPDCTGMFITFISKGRVRGCFGAFTHQYSSPDEILRYYIKGALFLDPRHTPLEKHELDHTDIVLTVTSNPEPVEDINTVDISNFGLLIECDNSAKTVIVPAEFKTVSKILKTAGNPGCRFYKFRAVTLR